MYCEVDSCILFEPKVKAVTGDPWSIVGPSRWFQFDYLFASTINKTMLQDMDSINYLKKCLVQLTIIDVYSMSQKYMPFQENLGP